MFTLYINNKALLLVADEKTVMSEGIVKTRDELNVHIAASSLKAIADSDLGCIIVPYISNNESKYKEVLAPIFNQTYLKTYASSTSATDVASYSLWSIEELQAELHNLRKSLTATPFSELADEIAKHELYSILASILYKQIHAQKPLNIAFEHTVDWMLDYSELGAEILSIVKYNKPDKQGQLKRALPKKFNYQLMNYPSDNQTALAIAIENKDEETTLLLYQAGADFRKMQGKKTLLRICEEKLPKLVTTIDTMEKQRIPEISRLELEEKPDLPLRHVAKQKSGLDIIPHESQMMISAYLTYWELQQITFVAKFTYHGGFYNAFYMRYMAKAPNDHPDLLFYNQRLSIAEKLALNRNWASSRHIFSGVIAKATQSNQEPIVDFIGNSLSNVFYRMDVSVNQAHDRNQVIAQLMENFSRRIDTYLSPARALKSFELLTTLLDIRNQYHLTVKPYLSITERQQYEEKIATFLNAKMERIAVLAATLLCTNPLYTETTERVMRAIDLSTNKFNQYRTVYYSFSPLPAHRTGTFINTFNELDDKTGIKQYYLRYPKLSIHNIYYDLQGRFLQLYKRLLKKNNVNAISLITWLDECIAILELEALKLFLQKQIWHDIIVKYLKQSVKIHFSDTRNISFFLKKLSQYLSSDQVARDIEDYLDNEINQGQQDIAENENRQAEDDPQIFNLSINGVIFNNPTNNYISINQFNLFNLIMIQFYPSSNVFKKKLEDKFFINRLIAIRFFINRLHDENRIAQKLLYALMSCDQDYFENARPCFSPKPDYFITLIDQIINCLPARKINTVIQACKQIKNILYGVIIHILLLNRMIANQVANKDITQLAERMVNLLLINDNPAHVPVLCLAAIAKLKNHPGYFVFINHLIDRLTKECNPPNHFNAQRAADFLLRLNADGLIDEISECNDLMTYNRDTKSNNMFTRLPRTTTYVVKRMDLPKVIEPMLKRSRKETLLKSFQSSLLLHYIQHLQRFGLYHELYAIFVIVINEYSEIDPSKQATKANFLASTLKMTAFGLHKDNLAQWSFAVTNTGISPVFFTHLNSIWQQLPDYEHDQVVVVEEKETITCDDKPDDCLPSVPSTPVISISTDGAINNRTLFAQSTRQPTTSVTTQPGDSHLAEAKEHQGDRQLGLQ